MAPPFRRPIPESVKTVLNSRLDLYTKGDIEKYYKPKTRNTAYCIITKNGVSVSTRENTFTETYNPNSLKPKPNLLSAEIERTGTDASIVNLSMRIRATIEVYSLSDFLTYSEIFCINDPRNELSITMGYSAPFDGCPSYTIKGCFIAYGTWQSTNENYYQLSFEAVGPGEVFSTLDIGLSGLWDANPPLEYKNEKSFTNGEGKGKVSGYYELMLYDAQNSGAFLTDTIEDGKIIAYKRIKSYEGYVKPNGFLYLNFGSGLPLGEIVVYKPVEGRTLSPDLEEIPSAQTKTDEYFTLQYVVDRIINEFALFPFYEKYTESDSKVKHVYIGFAKKPRCSTITGNVVRSCDPKKILILGGGAGDYRDKENPAKGKNYEQVKGNFNYVKSHYSTYIDFRKILIHRNTLYNTLSSNMHKPDPSSNSTNKFTPEEYLKVDTFFKSLFRVISDCTGGFVQLGLVQDDGSPDVEDVSNHNVLRIVPTTFVDDSFNVWKFNTLNGDGSTRELQITAELPSTDLHASLVKNIYNSSRSSHAVREGNTNDGLPSEDMKKIIQELVVEYYRGKMPQTYYSEETCDGARTLLSSLFRGQSTTDLINNNQYLWLMKMNVKMDGVGGWRIGHHINSNTVPKSFTTERNIAFVVSRVSHRIQNQDWETELDSICTAIPSGIPTLGAK
jgi:hypothetical protein